MYRFERTDILRIWLTLFTHVHLSMSFHSLSSLHSLSVLCDLFFSIKALHVLLYWFFHIFLFVFEFLLGMFTGARTKFVYRSMDTLPVANTTEENVSPPS